MLEKRLSTSSASTRGSTVTAQPEEDVVQGGGFLFNVLSKGFNKSSWRHIDQPLLKVRATVSMLIEK